MLPLPPSSTLFPYTTLFRSGATADKEAQLLASQLQITEFSNQLKGQEAALEREQELLSAGRDIRDVMGARNLHIIDVHDMDRSEEHTSELQSHSDLVCRLLL